MKEVKQQLNQVNNKVLQTKEEVYQALQERAGCDLKIRLKNMRARQALEGVAKSKLDNLNYLDVIAQDKKLIEIYTSIVKEMAIKHGINGGVA